MPSGLDRSGEHDLRFVYVFVRVHARAPYLALRELEFFFFSVAGFEGGGLGWFASPPRAGNPGCRWLASIRSFFVVVRRESGGTAPISELLSSATAAALLRRC